MSVRLFYFTFQETRKTGVASSYERSELELVTESSWTDIKQMRVARKCHLILFYRIRRSRKELLTTNLLFDYIKSETK
jgi:hypothetical protein